MDKMVNRAAQLWQNWTAQQKMFENVLGKVLNAGDLKRQEYDFLKAGLHRLSANPTPDEHLFMGLLKKHTDRLEKQIFPNPVVRALVQFKALMFDQPLMIARQNKLEETNQVQLNDQLSQMGFRSPALDLGKHLDFERPQVNIELGTQLNDQKSFETVLQFEKDGSGAYRLGSFTGTVKNPAIPEEARSYRFTADSAITTKEAVNLLQGRAVRKDEQWLQLDFNHRDASGQYQVKRFDADYGFELKKELAVLGAHLNQPGLNTNPLTEALEEGKQISINVGNAPYLVEAAPGQRTLNIRDAADKIVPLEALAKKLRQQEKMPDLAKVKSINIRKDKEADQSLMIG